MFWGQMVHKATSKNSDITIDEEWQDGYKRQMEIYQWLFRKNGFKVSRIGYFVYCNGDTDKEAFDGKLEFDVKLLPHEGDDTWIDDTVNDIHVCVVSDNVPSANEDCDFCAYRNAVTAVTT